VKHKLNKWPDSILTNRENVVVDIFLLRIFVTNDSHFDKDMSALAFSRYTKSLVITELTLGTSRAS